MLRGLCVLEMYTSIYIEGNTVLDQVGWTKLLTELSSCGYT